MVDCLAPTYIHTKELPIHFGWFNCLVNNLVQPTWLLHYCVWKRKWLIVKCQHTVNRVSNTFSQLIKCSLINKIIVMEQRGNFVSICWTDMNI
jgi:hypothetical protein